VLGVVALAGLRPWATSSLTPNLSLAPGIGVALGDSTVVARAESGGVGTGGIAAPASPARVSAPVAVPGAVPKHRTSQPLLAVSPGRPLQAAPAPVPAPVSSPPAPELPPSPEPVVATPAPAQAPAPPLVATVENGEQGTAGRPGTSVFGGEPERSCEGDEYVISVTFEETEGEEVDYELVEADILLQRLEADGSRTELHLRGDLNDVRSLVATFVSAGNCVLVEVQPPFGTDPAEDASDAGAEAAGTGAPEPVLP
jgi:hypothetical protein